MQRPLAIRPDFVREYHRRHSNGWENRNQLLRERDTAYGLLNEEFGKPGSSSFQGQAGPEYHRRYKVIDAKFRPRYDAISTSEKRWAFQSDMTVPEYLFLDGFGMELASIVQRPDFDTMHIWSFIDAGADVLLARWKEEYTVVGMQKRVDYEIKLFRFPRQRCICHFNLLPWHLGAHGQIRFYKKLWAKSLRERFARMRVT